MPRAIAVTEATEGVAVSTSPAELVAAGSCTSSQSPSRHRAAVRHQPSAINSVRVNAPTVLSRQLQPIHLYRYCLVHP